MFLVFMESAENLGLQFAAEKIVVEGELKNQAVDAQHFGHAGFSKKKIAKSCIFGCSRMRKDNDSKCNTCKFCMSSGKSLKYQSLFSQKTSLLLQAELAIRFSQEII